MKTKVIIESKVGEWAECKAIKTAVRGSDRAEVAVLMGTGVQAAQVDSFQNLNHVKRNRFCGKSRCSQDLQCDFWQGCKNCENPRKSKRIKPAGEGHGGCDVNWMDIVRLCSDMPAYVRISVEKEVFGRRHSGEFKVFQGFILQTIPKGAN